MRWICVLQICTLFAACVAVAETGTEVAAATPGVVTVEGPSLPTAWDGLKAAAQTYIAARSDTKAAAAWLVRFESRIKDRMEASRLSRDAVAQAMVLDWLCDKEDALKAKQPEAILGACRIFVWLGDAGIDLPSKVREGLEKENRMAKLAQYLLEHAKAD